MNTGGSRLSLIPLHYGVPLGSVLMPILFTLYTTSLGQICHSQNLLFYLYADDQQLYFSFRPDVPGTKGMQSRTTGIQSACITEIEGYIWDWPIGDIHSWMATNMLKPNDDKTKFMILSTRQQLAKISHITITIGSKTNTPTNFIHNLGFLYG